MKTKIYTDKEKICQYLENKGYSKNSFYKETGLSNGFLDSGSSFSIENLRIIIDKYRDLNLDWLLFDQGEMLQSEKKYENFEDDEMSVQLCIELKREKKDQVLRLVFGDNNLEILNK